MDDREWGKFEEILQEHLRRFQGSLNELTTDLYLKLQLLSMLIDASIRAKMEEEKLPEDKKGTISLLPIAEGIAFLILRNAWAGVVKNTDEGKEAMRARCMSAMELTLAEAFEGRPVEGPEDVNPGSPEVPKPTVPGMGRA